MKINISRQNLYLLSLSVFLLLFVLVFAFALLIPEGKEYRNKRADLKKENKELKKYQNFRDDVLDQLTDLKSENRNVIAAFDRSFDALRFEKMHRNYFNSLKVEEKIQLENDNTFSVYEVNTTSQINSPKSFYDFLDAVNKSDWIISINFPIHFKREAEMIRSSFTMKVYGIAMDSNTTDSNLSK
ncbi:MAG: hypothetical protein ACI9TV_000565 [Sulfurimonas sp.]|jgi:hypothetical protein|uniref:hypothetical protein n=1 Tax=Sulfurimonas sp. TaxID=2022749 RepID=UPI0039E329AD